MMTVLAALRDKLALVTGIATCKVGMESNMTPADYPMVRIVPSVIRDAPIIGRRRCDVLVYFGQPILEFTGGLESLYASVFALETALLEVAQATAGV